MPTSRDAELPETAIGSVVSMADKVDTISACFVAGLIPTGASDPYALRRQAIGIINILLDKSFHISTDEVFGFALKTINKQGEGKFANNLDNALAEISDFIKERFRNIMISDGFPQDVVDAVVSAGFDDIVEVKRKIEALSEFRKAPEFESLGVAFKRVVNIVKGHPGDGVNESLFVEPVEKELYESFVETRETVGRHMSDKNYPETLTVMKNLKEPVDKFFDHVMVMDENPEIRQNRLSILWDIRELFFKIADFSKLSTQTDQKN